MPHVRGSGEYRSALEARIFNDLKKRKVKFTYEPFTIPFYRKVRQARCTHCGGKDIYVRREYTPDASVADFLIEVKGKFTASDRARMEDFLKNYPGTDLRFIFQRDNWLTKKHASKYSDWCTKNKVVYHIGEKVPVEWCLQQC